MSKITANIQSPSKLSDKIKYSIELLRKCESMALEMDPENGFYLAFSGGKDSQVLYSLAVMGGVKFKAHMNLTSVDPPEVIRFVKHHYPEVEMDRHKFSGTFDQWSEHREKMVTCVKGKDKILVSPILQWTEKDVWDFLKGNNIPYCSLYDKGYKRIGCILCPMSNHKQKLKEIKDFPHVRDKWIKTIKWLIENKWTDTSLSDDEEMAFNWWISGKSFKQFYADEYLQMKLDF